MNDLAEIYRAVYEDPAHATYGRGLERCAPFIRRIWNAGLSSVISLGCGHGDELIALHGLIPRCLGVDFALPPKVWPSTPGRSLSRIQAALQDLQAPLRFGAVVSFDVLEHIPEEDIDRVLRTTYALAPLACLVIANMPDQHRLSDGRVIDLHLIQKPADWWIWRIRRATGWKVEMQALETGKRFGFWCGEWP